MNAVSNIELFDTNEVEAVARALCAAAEAGYEAGVSGARRRDIVPTGRTPSDMPNRAAWLAAARVLLRQL